MPPPLIIEVNPNDREPIDKFAKEHQDTADVIEAKHLTGLEILQLIITYGPNMISAIVALIAVLRQSKTDFTIVLPNGKRVQNPSDEDIRHLTSTNSQQNDATP